MFQAFKFFFPLDNSISNIMPILQVGKFEKES